MIITENTTLEPGVHVLPEGITIAAGGITLDGNDALLVGRSRQGNGVTVRGQDGVIIKNLRLRDYYHGIHAENARDLTISDCQIASTAEVAPNTIFLNIWLPVEEAYGGGILLNRVTDSTIEHNDLQHQMNGLLTYNCDRLNVRGNVASYNSGFGILLSNTNDSLFEENYADYCCRWEPRGGRTGHMGADATGFLILSGSSHNIFRRNYARMGGDGFFMAGLNPQFVLRPCNDNLFEENDASHSPNIGFEATFCANNTFRDNLANRCNYGFWLGFSRDSVLRGNQMHYCTQAGIAVENGYGFVVEDNNFSHSPHGILLWSKRLENFLNVVPDNDTSHDWTIARNTFKRNDRAIRIAADQDHGIRPYATPGKRPYSHFIRENTIEDNRLGIELVDADGTVIERNQMAGNVEADVR